MRKSKNPVFFPHFMIYDTTEKIKSLVFFLIFDKIIFGRSALVGWTAVRVGKIIWNGKMPEMEENMTNQKGHGQVAEKAGEELKVLNDREAEEADRKSVV